MLNDELLCPKCRHACEVDRHTQTFFCPACGWRPPETFAQAPTPWLRWFFLALAPVILWPILAALRMPGELMIGLLLVGAGCCLVAGIGMAARLTQETVTRFFLGMFIAAGLALLDLFIVALGACAGLGR